MPKLTYIPEDDEPPIAPVKDLRDWFAGQALNGLLSTYSPDHSEPNPDYVAGWAYHIADAMLEARAK